MLFVCNSFVMARQKGEARFHQGRTLCLSDILIDAVFISGRVAVKPPHADPEASETVSVAPGCHEPRYFPALPRADKLVKKNLRIRGVDRCGA